MFKKLFGQKVEPKKSNQNQIEQMSQIQMNLDNLNDELLKKNEQMLKAYHAMMV